MTSEARCAFVLSQVACANAEIAGMQAENTAATAAGRRPPYDKAHFDAVPDRFQIGWNAVLQYLGN